MKTVRFILVILWLALPQVADCVLTSGSVTIKLSGGTYSTWAAFWDDIGNLTGNITCTVDASAFTEATAPVTVAESLNGYTLHVLPAAFPTTTNASTGARFTCDHIGKILDLRMEGPGDLIIEGMVFIAGTSNPRNGLVLTGIDTEFNFTYRRNILKGTNNYTVDLDDATMNAGIKVYNNIMYDVILVGVAISTAIPAALIANNTVVGGLQNFDVNNSEATLKNNLAFGGTSYDYHFIGLAATGLNNAGSNADCADGNWGGTGTNNLINISDPFNNLGADDFTITAQGVIGGAGLDLSGDFTDDFFGVTRVNWTIGACEYTGVITPPPGWSGGVMGITDPAAVMGVEKANIAKIMGVE